MTDTAHQPAAGPPAAARRKEVREARDRRAEWWERRLAVPVIAAATVSIPAVFLTMMQSNLLQVAGHTLNWLSLVVLGGEMVLLLVMCGDTPAWIRRHKWTIAITVLAFPAVVFAIAPVQALRLLRLVRLVGTLRILRANTIVSAGRTLARRFGLAGPWRFIPVLGASVLAAAFVALVLVDPTAIRQHEELVAEVTGWTGIVPVVVAGLILGAATYIVIRYRRRDTDTDDVPTGSGKPADPATGPPRRPDD